MHMDSENWQTFGHENIKQLLNLQLQNGKLSHAYLLSGPQGVGKKNVALEFAGKILGNMNPLRHPDFSILDVPNVPSLEQVQQFMSGISLKPFSASHKVAIINHAEQLNIQSCNALLKTLEEPSGSTILILLASHKNLLPTVLSRCQIFSFTSFSQKQMRAYAAQKNIAVTDRLLQLSFGRPERLDHLHAKGLAQDDAEIKKFIALEQMPRLERLAELGELAEAETEDVTSRLLLWALWQTEQLRTDTLKFRSVRAIAEALEALGKNQNKKLILQQLLLKL